MRSYWEYVLPALAIVSLLISCAFVSSKKIFWNDELYSYYFTSDPSFTGMLAAFHDKINNTPFLYFLLGWTWDKAFGSSELSLRLFSSLGMCAALVATWVVVRRHFRFWATATGVLGIFCTSEVILIQNAEARMYGLFIALCAAGLLLYDQFYRQSRPTTKLLVLNACVHMAIIHTHLFGGFYSGTILVALLVSDWFFNTFRLKIYLSIVLSWFTILLYIPSFLIQADAGKPRTWLPEPLLRDLLDMLNFGASPFLHQTLLVILLILSVCLFFAKEAVRSAGIVVPEPVTESRSKVPIMVFALSFVLLPIFIWIISKTIKPILWDRYMIPSALGWVIMLAYFSSKLLSIPPFRKQLYFGAGRYKYLPTLTFLFSVLVLSSYFLSRPLLYARSFGKQFKPGRNETPVRYKNLPIVVQFSRPFLERIHYAPNPERYYFITDWEVAVDKHSGLFSPQEYKHLVAIKRNYPEIFKDNILTTEEFLQRYDRFLVLDHPDYKRKCPPAPKGLEEAREWTDVHCPRWVEMRLLNNDDYKVTFLNDDHWFAVLLVERRKN